MSEHKGNKLSPSKKLLLISAGMVALTMPIVFGQITSTPGGSGPRAEDAPAKVPKFEIASVKPSIDPGQAVGLANYAHAFQLGITALLAGCMVTIAVWRFWP